MTATIAQGALEAEKSRGWRDTALFAAGGLLLWWLCGYHSSWMPVWAPWDFSWAWYGAFALTGWCYVRGLRRVATPRWRIASFAAGMAMIWAVLQTRFEYLAQHMFFLNRVQHDVMHHLGPLLIAIAWPWPLLDAGAPRWLRRIARRRWFAVMLRFFQRPVLACVVFVGLIALWLFPPVHFVAMIDHRLYAVMNWSMVIDGMLFWSVVLDPRGSAEARNSFAARMFMAAAIALPQIAMGAAIAFADTDIYRFYAWCGRVFPIDAVTDQRIGGLLVWLPPAMMSVVTMLWVLRLMRADEERGTDGVGDMDAIAPVRPAG